ncbi:GGDEF domain-containing phosphodiesterase [Idiomarina aminovorans]|uniref:GGDEF domain-containing phosphodiesterase n=1 Tax=Idiomarina aminovorans TaxID=2914829 RepID=UPI0020063542|nr:GGDEF domain-containing phosphodiesterase [Idiomarina sp. ATCH4]MCK7460166.1 EAL domain-containing protein [Idiomarina sp. ATCH4]
MTNNFNWPVSAKQLLEKTENLTKSGSWCIDVEANTLFWSLHTYELFERSSHEPPSVDEAVKYYCSPYDQIILDAIDNAVEKSKPWCLKAQVITEKGTTKWIKTCGSVFESVAGKTFLFGSIQDISSSHANLTELERQTVALNTILDNLVDGVITIDSKGIIQGFSKPAERIFGYQASDVIGTNVKILMPQPYRREHDQYLKNYNKTGKKKIIGIGREVIGARKDGSTFPIELAVSETDTPNGKRFIGMVRDITQQKKAAEKIEFLSHYDELTRLPNRTRLIEQVETWGAEAKITVACINIDYFRRINSVLGESVGDEVLAVVAERIKLNVDANALLAKDLADKFIVAFTHAHCPEQASLAQIQSLLPLMREPVQTSHSHKIHVTVSIGIATLNKGTNSNHALVNAESALASAKAQGRNRLSIYQELMQSNLQHDYALETALHNELECIDTGCETGLKCWLQSKVGRDYKTLGAEALIRWQLGDRMVPPDEFIPLAEQLGLIVPIGHWMLEQVAQVIKETNKPVAINVSPKEFLHEGFTAQIFETMNRVGAPTERLIIEITENLLLQQHQKVLSIMKTLDQAGVKFSIDDFGTGYSNLSRLQWLPVSELKIDKEFIQSAFESERDRNLLDSIILMAKQMRVSIVAEGVETGLQATYLKDSGVDLQQGFYFHKPQPEKDWIKNITSSKSRGA